MLFVKKSLLNKQANQIKSNQIENSNKNDLKIGQLTNTILTFIINSEI
jgi:hypothetical protein